MKVTGGRPQLQANISPRTRNLSADSDLQPRSCRKPARRKVKNPSFSGAGTRLRRSRTPVGKRSRPETPLLKWKIDDRSAAAGVEDDKGVHRKKGREIAVSARKLGAVLWRLQLPEVGTGTRRSGGLRRSGGALGFEPGAGHVGVQFLCHTSGKANGSEAKDLLKSPNYFSGRKNGFLSKLEPSFQFSSTVMEGATKWDPVCSRPLDHDFQIYGHMKRIDQPVSAVPMVSSLEAELERAQACIQELELERRSSKKKLGHFLKKVSEERAAWRSREHEKIRAFIDDLKADLSREKKNRQRLEIVNSKLVNELADTKRTAKRFMQEYEKERKTRELIEEVCDELANEIGEDKAEVEAVKTESMKFREEAEEERKMLQMAEVWREERVQMKLVDAKLALEEKYSQMSKLVAELETFLKSRSATPDVKELKQAELLWQAAAAVNIQDIKEFTYEPANPDDIFSVFEHVNFGESDGREIKPCVAYSPASHASKIRTVSPEVNMMKKGSVHRHSNAFSDQNADIEDDESGWETVSHLEDQGSSYSPEGSAISATKNCRNSNASGSTEWEDNLGRDTPITEISEICSVSNKQLKKPSVTRLWRSFSNSGETYKVIAVEGGRLSNGRMSNASNVSLDRGSCNGGFGPADVLGQCSSPESGNPDMGRGRKSGCMEWPRGMQKNSLKAKLLEARMESQKLQLRQVLKQKI